MRALVVDRRKEDEEALIRASVIEKIYEILVSEESTDNLRRAAAELLAYLSQSQGVRDVIARLPKVDVADKLAVSETENDEELRTFVDLLQKSE